MKVLLIICIFLYLCADAYAMNDDYQKMTEAQQYEFLDRAARRITVMMGNREAVLDREVIGYIKQYVDSYAKRSGNRSSTLWSEDLISVYNRGSRYAPGIIASFRKQGVPSVIGLYIPMIESEYRECLQSPVGALGMFQFMPATATQYNLRPEDRCDVLKAAPAAARYMDDRIKEFGKDAKSVTLGIAAYNRSPKSVMRDLQLVVDKRNDERSFWTLIARKEMLDRYFQRENVKYVPKFFAAAIIGENPSVFKLPIRKLSTYDKI